MTETKKGAQIQQVADSDIKPYIVPPKWQGLPQPVIEQLRVFEIYIKSNMLPSSVDTPEKALVISVSGRELGIPPMMAFKHLYVVEGTPAVDGIILQALMIKNKITWKTIEDFVEDPDVDGMMPGFRNRRTTVEFYYGDMVERGSFTKKRAVQTTVSEKKGTKLIDKFNYQNWLPEMLWWRAFTIGARRIAGGLMAGIRFADELDLVVGPDGNVLGENDIKAIAERDQQGPVKEVKAGADIIIPDISLPDQPTKAEKDAKELLTKKLNTDGKNESIKKEAGSQGGTSNPTDTAGK